MIISGGEINNKSKKQLNYHKIIVLALEIEFKIASELTWVAYKIIHYKLPRIIEHSIFICISATTNVS